MKKLYCIPKTEQLDRFYQFSKNYNAGFEYNDFFLPAVLDDPDLTRQKIDAYLSLDRDRSEDTLHGAFFDICVNSDDPLIFAASDRRVRQTMDIAKTLGVKAVIFHTNHIPNFRLASYRKNWLLRNESYWRSLLLDYPTLTVYLENMFDEEPDLLCRLAGSLSDEPRFGVCLDFAHAYLSHTDLSVWCDACRPYTRHLHINDNFKDADSHRPVGSGSLPWELYRDFISSFPDGEKPSVLIEVRGFTDLVTSVRYMEENGLYPF